MIHLQNECYPPILLYFLNYNKHTTALFIAAIVLLWMASKMEDDYNIEQFGDKYREHMIHVPRWNIFKGLRKR
jgi:protein-S-isoprenylcysteine O-methyltransferase Ste14